MAFLRRGRARRRWGRWLCLRFRDANHIFIGNFYAHGLIFSPERETVFENDRFAGVRNHCADGREVDFTGAVVCLDPFSDERFVACHALGHRKCRWEPVMLP